jgi:hypothetical protein
LRLVSRRVHLASRLRSVNSAFPHAAALKFGLPFELGHARTNREHLVGAGKLGKPRAGRLWPLIGLEVRGSTRPKAINLLTGTPCAASPIWQNEPDGDAKRGGGTLAKRTQARIAICRGEAWRVADARKRANASPLPTARDNILAKRTQGVPMPRQVQCATPAERTRAFPESALLAKRTRGLSARRPMQKPIGKTNPRMPDISRESPVRAEAAT